MAAHVPATDAHRSPLALVCVRSQAESTEAVGFPKPTAFFIAHNEISCGSPQISNPPVRGCPT